MFSRVAGDAALVELLPAIRIETRPSDSGQGPIELRSLVDMADAPEGRPAEESDGLTAEERDDYAERFKAAVGAPLTAAELPALRADAAAGRLSRRRLHPAG